MYLLESYLIEIYLFLRIHKASSPIPNSVALEGSGSCLSIKNCILILLAAKLVHANSGLGAYRITHAD